MASVFKVESLPKVEPIIPTQSLRTDICLIPCHLRPDICSEHQNPATGTSCRKRHNTGGHNRGSVKKSQ